MYLTNMQIALASDAAHSNNEPSFPHCSHWTSAVQTQSRQMQLMLFRYMQQKHFKRFSALLYQKMQ